MNYVADVRFALVVLLGLIALGVLIVSVRVPGRGWLAGFILLTLITQAGFYLPLLMLRNQLMAADVYKQIMETANIVLGLLGVLAWALLLVFVVTLQSISRPAVPGPAASPSPATGLADRGPLYGVGGWLRFIVIANIYLAPIVVALQYMVGWVGFIVLSRIQPGILAVGLFFTLVDVALVLMGICVGRALGNIRPGAVQRMRRLLILRLGWAVIAAPLLIVGWSLPGLKPADALPGAIKGLIVGVIGFIVGWTYFKVSKRVKATYPDWQV